MASLHSLVSQAEDRALRIAAARAFPLYTGLTGFYVVFRIGSFTNIPGRITDTPGYERVAGAPIWSWDFVAGERGFTVPLLYKLVESDEARILAQLGISTISWLVLGAVVATTVRSEWLRPIALALVLAFSLTTEIILWDTLLWSESLTFAFAALLVAACLMLVRRRRYRWVGLVLLISVLWAFARDSNAYVVLVVGVVAAVSALGGDHRRQLVSLAAGCVAIFVAVSLSANAGERWLQPLRDIVAHRVVPEPDLRCFFEQHGLDQESNWPQSEWMEERARWIYVGYLATHPGYTLLQPFHGRQRALHSSESNRSSLLDPDLTIYNDNADKRFLTLPDALNQLLFPRGMLLATAALLAVPLVIAAAWIGRASATWIVPLGILVTTYPHFLVAWHFSGIEGRSARPRSLGVAAVGPHHAPCPRRR